MAANKSEQPAANAKAAPHIDDCEHTSSRNARVGMVLFVLYLALYGGFMGLSTFAYEQMRRPVLAGVNLAIIYGFGLIAAAILLSLVYMVLCRGAARGSEMHKSTGEARR